MAEKLPRQETLPLRQPFFEPSANHLLEMSLDRFTVGHGELGQQVSRQGQVQIAPFRDSKRVRRRLREIAEHPHHVFGRFEVVLLGVFQTLGILDGLAGLNADQHLVGEMIVPAEEMAIVGPHQRQIQVPGDFQEPPVDLFLLRNPLVLDLQEKIPATEDLEVRLGGPLGTVSVIPQEAGGDLPSQTGGSADQPFRVLGQELPVDPRLVVETVQVGTRDKLEEVLIAGPVLGEEDQVVVGLLPLARRRPIGSAARGHVDFAPQDRPDPLLAALFEEPDGAEEVPMIRNGDGGHLKGHRLVHHLLDLLRSVEEGELGMVVEVDEVSGPHRLSGLPAAGSQQLRGTRHPTRSWRAAGGSIPSDPGRGRPDAAGREIPGGRRGVGVGPRGRPDGPLPGDSHPEHPGFSEFPPG